MAKGNWLAAALDRAFSVGGQRPAISMTVKGQEPAIRALNALPEKVAMRVMRAAMKKAQIPGERAAKEAAERLRTKRVNGGPHLADTARNLVKTYRNAMVIYGMVGFTARHSWLVEHGHRMVVGGTVARINPLRTDYGRAPYVKIGKGKDAVIDWTKTGKGRIVGAVPAHPWMGPVMGRVSAQMAEIFVSELKKATGRAIARIAKEAGAA